MKVKIVVLILLCTSISLFSQQEKNIKFGVKGGVNYSNILVRLGEQNFDGNYKFGYQIGGFSKIKLSESLYLKPEILFSLQGMKDKVQLTDEYGEYLSIFTVIFNEYSIILPLPINFYLNSNLNLFIGPQIDYLFYLKVRDNSDEITGDGGDNMSEFYLGALGGVGYDFTSNIGVEVHYNYGFNRLNASNRQGDNRTNSSVWMLNLNYTFN